MGSPYHPSKCPQPVGAKFQLSTHWLVTEWLTGVEWRASNVAKKVERNLFKQIKYICGFYGTLLCFFLKVLFCMCSVFFCLYLQLSAVALYCSRVSSGQHDLQYSASHQMTCFDLFLFSLLNTISGHFLFACLISYSFIENKKSNKTKKTIFIFFFYRI